MKENDKQNNDLMLSGFSGDHAGEYPVLFANFHTHH